MSETQIRLGITTAPFLKSGLGTRRLMWEVFAALLPVLAAATWYFGVTALLVVSSAVCGALLTEWCLTPSDRRSTLSDGSALLTGVLLGLTLPPSIPLWMAFFGAVVAIALGKSIWGGLGRNLFNPALVGRAFLQAAFPLTLTTWTAPGSGVLAVGDSTWSLPLTRLTDGTTCATPLGLAKFEGRPTATTELFWGQVGGSLGETASAVLIACGIFLALRRVFDWRLPVSTLLTVALLSETLHRVEPSRFPGAAFMLLSGGLLFAAVFMVTDPVTTPLTRRGTWWFGVGVGVLVVLIRLFGGLPEGVMYAVLLMNAVTPLINRYTQPRRFGG
ncbi:MAG TPA: RnfABCDGE type electron transport complex subunit D [Candidatus Polarisedimenticolaceae bacterium]|nr:RnfABCDGE type electron transport complex subunit D [Candidatus Polarisedimenticolaceae bacterium]